MQTQYSEMIKFQLHLPKTEINRPIQQPTNIQNHSPAQIIHSNYHSTLDNHPQYSQYLTINSTQNPQIPIHNVLNNKDQRYSLPNYNLRQDVNQVIPSSMLNSKTHNTQHPKTNQFTDTILISQPPIHNTINLQSPQTNANSPQDFTTQHKIYKIPQHIIRNLQATQTQPIKIDLHIPKPSDHHQHPLDNKFHIPHQHPLTKSPAIPPSRQTGRFCQSMIIQDKNLDQKYNHTHHTDIKLGPFGNSNSSAYNNHYSGSKAATATKSYGRISNASNDSNSNLKKSQACDLKNLHNNDGMTSIKINGKSYAQTQEGSDKKIEDNSNFYSTANSFTNIRHHIIQQPKRSSQFSINKNQSAGNLSKMSNIKLSQPIHIKNDDFLKDVRKSIQNLKVDDHKPKNSPITQGFPRPVPPIDRKFHKKNDGVTTPQKDHTSHAPGFIQKKTKQQIPSARNFTYDDFQIIQKLGKGTYGDVFLARDRKTRFICVLKALSKKRIKQLGLQNHVFRQIKIQSYLVHKHITCLYGVFDDQNKIYLIMECVPDGSMQSNGKKKISQSQAAHLIAQTCQGLLYIHRQNIIHRDIKPQNLLLNYTYLKIADFGCAVFGKTLRNTVVGSYVYISPEQFSNNPYDEKIDSWSVGILAYQMLIGKPPYQQKLRKIAMKGMTTSNITSNQSNSIKTPKISIEQTMDFPQVQFPQNINISLQAIQFIRRLLDKDPVTRADIKQALKHKFLIKAKQYQKYLQSQLQSKL